MNKPIQEKLRQHIYVTKEKHGGKFNNEYSTDLQYADMVLLGKVLKTLEKA